MTPPGIVFGTTVSNLMVGEIAELAEGVFNALAREPSSMSLSRT